MIIFEGLIFHDGNLEVVFAIIINFEVYLYPSYRMYPNKGKLRIKTSQIVVTMKYNLLPRVYDMLTETVNYRKF